MKECVCEKCERVSVASVLRARKCEAKCLCVVHSVFERLRARVPSTLYVCESECRRERAYHSLLVYE